MTVCCARLIGTSTTDSNLKRIISTNCCIHMVVPPDDGPRCARNMYRLMKHTNILLYYNILLYKYINWLLVKPTPSIYIGISELRLWNAVPTYISINSTSLERSFPTMQNLKSHILPLHLNIVFIDGLYYNTCFGLLEVIFRLWFKSVKYIINSALKWRCLVYSQMLKYYIKIRK